MLQNYLKGQGVHLTNELKLAIQIAQQGGQLAKTIRQQGYAIHDKADNQGPATDADLKISAFLSKQLRHHYPADLIVSEEAPVPSFNDAKRIWYIDPIDGTKEFISGNNDWSVMIGLAIEGKPCLGVVYRPDVDELYYSSQNQGAFFQTANTRVSLKVNETSEPRESILIQSRSHRSAEADDLAKVLGVKDIYSLGSIGLKLGKIAEGKADIYFNFSGKCHLWDLCGPEAILTEAGGAVALSAGEKILYGLDTHLTQSFVATTQCLLEKVYPFLK